MGENIEWAFAAEVLINGDSNHRDVHWDQSAGVVGYQKRAAVGDPLQPLDVGAEVELHRQPEQRHQSSDIGGIPERQPGSALRPVDRLFVGHLHHPYSVIGSVGGPVGPVHGIRSSSTVARAAWAQPGLGSAGQPTRLETGENSPDNVPHG